MIEIKKTGDWRKAASFLGAAPSAITIALNKAVMQEAHFFRKKVVEGITSQAPGGKKFKPLADTTLAIRRFRGFKGTKALLVTAELRNSTKVVAKRTLEGTEAFVGVHRNVRSKDGTRLIDIALVHEYGKTIVMEMTEVMRKFLAIALKDVPRPDTGSGGTGTRIIIIKIPARPFIQPVVDKYFTGPAASLRFQQRVVSNLGPLFALASGASLSGSVGVAAAKVAENLPSGSKDKLSREVFTGAKGGRYRLSGSGRKVYLKR